MADVLGSVDFFGDGFYLGLDRHVEVVKKLELAGLIGRSDNKFGKLGAFSPSAQYRRSGSKSAGLDRDTLDRLDLFGMVGFKRIDRDDRRYSVQPYVLDLLSKIRSRPTSPTLFSSISGGSAFPATMRYFPLCDFSARIVATMTQASASARCNGI